MRIFGSRRDRRSGGQARSSRGPIGNGDGARAPLADIDDLIRRNRERRDPVVERELVRVRHEAFDALPSSPSDAPPRVEPRGDARVEQGLAVVGPEQLSTETVRDAILSRGSVHVPGFISPARAEELADGIDRTFAACDARAEPGTTEDSDGWYQPFKLPASWNPGTRRKWNRDGGAIWAADSPRLLFELLDTFERLGMREVISSYLGERPIVSMNKSVLRRVSAGAGAGDWHQDGSFLGAEIRSLNVWLALSECGRDAPGMDLVPLRLDGIVETGTEGANFDWTVSPKVVDEAAGDAGITRPVFQAGDALLFDHLCLHRTASDASMTRARYAIETWFFAPSTYPSDQIPLVF
jgi:Phytanoyl-CoA dioxygenase (PhyH)